MGKISARQIKTAGPSTVGAANDPGSGEDVALASHVHAHGSHTDPSAHALATVVNPGFMSAWDKARLDMDSTVFIVAGVSKANFDLSLTSAEPGPLLEANTVAFSVNYGDLLLLKDQTDPKKNGVYQVGSDYLNFSSYLRVGGYDAETGEKGVTVFDLWSKAVWISRASNWETNGASYHRAHGNLPTGSAYHASATTTQPGFLSAADKTKLDGLLSGQMFRAVVEYAFTSNVNLAGGAGSLTGTFDGLATTAFAGYFVLLTAQTDAKQNGVYSVPAGAGSNPSAWTRASGVNATSDFAKSFAVYVRSGTIYAGSVWLFIAVPGATTTLGTSNLPFKRFNAAVSALATATASLSVNSQKITNLATPTSGLDAANKGYVDGALSGVSGGLSPLDQVRVTGMTVGRYMDIVGHANVIDLWHAHAGLAFTGGNVASWTGQSRGTTVPAWVNNDAPYYTAAEFGGNEIIKPIRFQTQTQLSTPLAVHGDTPYLICAFRRTNDLPHEEGGSLFVAGQVWVCVFGITDESTDGSRLRLMTNSVWNDGPIIYTSDYDPHILEAWCDGASNNMRLDGGTIVSTSGNGSLTDVVNSIGLANWSHTYHKPFRSETAMFFLLKQKPSEEVCAALRSWIHQDWAF